MSFWVCHLMIVSGLQLCGLTMATLTENNEMVSVETLNPNDEVVSAETLNPNGALVVSAETQPLNDELASMEAQPVKNEQVIGEAQFSNDELPSIEREPPNNELPSMETQPLNNEPVSTETQPLDNEMISIETQHPNNEMVSMETQHPENEMISMETQHPNFELVSPEIQPSLEREPPNNELPSMEMEPLNNELVSTETQPLNNELISIETQHPNNEIISMETQHPNNEIISMETQHPNNEMISMEMQHPNFELVTPETQPNKKRKKKSIVWEHFTIEAAGPGCRRACCKQCGQSFAYSTGSKVAGTSHLKRHIAKGTCPVVLRNMEKNHLSPYSAPSKMGNHTPKRRHFLDSDWKMHRKVLNVVMEPYPDSEAAFSHAVSACLSDWNMDGRLFSVTINQPLSDTGIENLRTLLSVKNPRMLGGQLLVGSCLARTLSSIAQDALKAGQETVKKVRDSVKYVKTSESHEEKFLELKQRLQVPSTKSLALDDLTRWNTTYEMLLAASELKEVFSCLDTFDPDYKEAPTMEDWKLVETLCTYLKLLSDTASFLTTSIVPTTNTFFHEAWKIQLELARAATSEDPFISNLTKPMQESFDKYWKNCCLILAIAVVMDPRFKMKLVEFSFTKIYGDEAASYTRIVDEGIHELFSEYIALPLPLTPTFVEEANGAEFRPFKASPKQPD
ncbi:hypothetical protein RJ640_017064 [Escallonia rubra]|uniref:BED-type domain-containing protein n=1 Tax=Escallonia rubra TaxID=112253 RepID=A0AA88RV94_9ASTE|nr:hypothetical protein RJ640_017064 [Escallonia rubra]